MRYTHCRTLNMGRNSEKREKSEIHTAGPEIWPENLKTWKMRHKYYITWNIERKTEKHEKGDIYTVGPGIWREN